MIKHIVCFKLKDNSEEKKQEAKDMLLSMIGKVDLIKDIEVGTDFLSSERSYDIILHLKTGKHLISIRMTNTTAAWLNHICTV